MKSLEVREGLPLLKKGVRPSSGKKKKAPVGRPTAVWLLCGRVWSVRGSSSGRRTLCLRYSGRARFYYFRGRAPRGFGRLLVRSGLAAFGRSGTEALLSIFQSIYSRGVISLKFFEAAAVSATHPFSASLVFEEARHPGDRVNSRRPTEDGGARPIGDRVPPGYQPFLDQGAGGAGPTPTAVRW